MEVRQAQRLKDLERENARLKKAVADLQARIPKLADHEVVAGLMRLVAAVGDGHTVRSVDFVTCIVPSNVIVIDLLANLCRKNSICNGNG